MRIGNMKYGKIRIHIFTWKTLNKKTMSREKENPLNKKSVQETVVVAKKT